VSTLKVNNLQVGQDGTAANNYTLYQPASPDGTVRLGYGVAGSVTDILTLKNSRLGIGTANPEEDLHIASNSPYILLDDIDNSQKWKLKGTAWFAIEDTTSGVDRLRIGSAGQIGLGGANYGTSGQVLTSGGSGSAVTWSTIASDKITEGNTEAEVVDTGSDGHFKVTTEGSERLRITSDGNIGINSTNPTSYGNSQATLVIEDDTNPAICISDTGQSRDWWLVGQGDGLAIRYADGGGSGSASNVTSVVFFKDLGEEIYMGVGTNSPQEKLHVQGDIRLVDNGPRIGFHDANAANNLSCTGGIELFDSAGNRGAYMGATEGANFLSFGISPTAGAAPTEKLRITSDGKIGIGTANPSVSLDLASNTDAVSLPTGTTAQRPSGTDAYIRKNSTNNALEFYNGTNWVEIITDYFPTGSTTLG